MSDFNDYGSVPTGPPNSSMAIVSLIAGILGLTLFPVVGSIVAVITGPMAKKEIAASAGTLGGERLATAGMIMGWIGIALLMLGLCLGIFLLAIPLCGLMFSFSGDSFNLILPGLLSAF